MSEVCPKGAGSAMVGLALGKYGWFPAGDDSAKKNNWVFGVGGQGPAVPSCALHHKTPQYMNQWPAWGTVGGWPGDTSIPCCKSVKSGNLKAGDEEDVITAAAVTTTTDNSSTDAEVARTVFGGIIAACCMYLVYIHATRKSAVYNAENSPPQAFDSMPTPAASNNANADNTARKNATISFI